MPTKISTLCLIIAFGFTLSGCSSMSAQARKERAYRHYVEKQMKQRQKAMAKAQKAANRQAKRQMKEQLKLAQPSEPKITAGVEDVSSEMPSVFEAAAPPPATPSDSVAPPVTVSASNEILATQNPDQPSPP